MPLLITYHSKKMMTSSEKTSGHCLYKDWMTLQEQELSELLQHSSKSDNNVHETTITTCDDNDAKVIELLDKITQNFEVYAARRSSLVRSINDASAFISPVWCSAFENSLSWIGGCRPSTFFSLVYALCGSDIESRMSQLFLDDKTSCDFPLLTASQLQSIDNLQRRTIKEEDKLSNRVATLQQEMGDMPLALIARRSKSNCELNPDAKHVIGKIQEAMVEVMVEADRLRIDIVKEIMSVLTPKQALEYVISAKKLRFCVQAWGIERDRELGN